MVRQQTGFSLVETLVAAMILFAVLSTAFLAFQGSILSSAKAQSRIELLASVPLIRRDISQRLRSTSNLSGRGVVDLFRYSWTATPRVSGSAFNPSLGESPTPSSEDREFVLWDVVFQVESAGSRREFAFIELAWSD
jgi:Tfp pilus assembly protein PilV